MSNGCRGEVEDNDDKMTGSPVVLEDVRDVMLNTENSVLIFKEKGPVVLSSLRFLVIPLAIFVFFDTPVNAAVITVSGTSNFDPTVGGMYDPNLVRLDKVEVTVDPDGDFVSESGFHSHTIKAGQRLTNLGLGPDVLIEFDSMQTNVAGAHAHLVRHQPFSFNGITIAFPTGFSAGGGHQHRIDLSPMLADSELAGSVDQDFGHVHYYDPPKMRFRNTDPGVLENYISGALDPYLLVGAQTTFGGEHYHVIPSGSYWATLTGPGYNGVRQLVNIETDVELTHNGQHDHYWPYNAPFPVAHSTTFYFAIIPEPASRALMLLGIGGVAILSRRRQRFIRPVSTAT